jgi:hypothetical protein
VPVDRARQRFRELIVYVSAKSAGDPYFGAVKLNKILYHSDFRAFERFGVPLTGLRYFKLRAGPAPRALRPVRQELIDEGAIRLDVIKIGDDLEQHRTIALRPPVLSHFTQDELDLVDEVIAELRSQTATEVSDASHDVRWRVLQLRDDLPYEFAYLSSDPVLASDIQRTRELAERFGWRAA